MLEDWLSAVFLFTSLFSHQRLQNLYSLVAFLFGVIAIGQVKCQTLLGKFSDWRPKKSIFVLPSSKLETAFQYCRKHMDKFMNVLKDGRLELSNNRAKRTVKKIVMGRKNWLFSQSSIGTKSMAIIMSMLETAKQNGLDQFKYMSYLLDKYMSYLLDKLPNEPSLLDNQRLEAYLLGQKMFISTVSKVP